MILGRFDDAARNLRDAVGRFGETQALQASAYQLAFVRRDEAELGRLMALATDSSFDLSGLVSQSETARGRLRDGRARMQRIVRELERRGLTEQAAMGVAFHAGREASAGNYRFTREARPTIEQLSKPNTLPRLVLAVAIAHDPSVTEPGTWMPADRPSGAPLPYHLGAATLRARLALNAGRAAEAVKVLAPFQGSMLINGPGLLSVMTYGRALLQAGDFAAAISEFTRILDHPGLDPTAIEHPLALVWLGRTHARAGDVAEARKAYEQFLALWKDADPDVPILLEAKAEYAKLAS
jgi:eukaryotic-like serine/threonine-protein kinase